VCIIHTHLINLFHLERFFAQTIGSEYVWQTINEIFEIMTRLVSVLEFKLQGCIGWWSHSKNLSKIYQKIVKFHQNLSKNCQISSKFIKNCQIPSKFIKKLSNSIKIYQKKISQSEKSFENSLFWLVVSNFTRNFVKIWHSQSENSIFYLRSDWPIFKNTQKSTINCCDYQLLQNCTKATRKKRQQSGVN
jgi:hypothetical protein